MFESQVLSDSIIKEKEIKKINTLLNKSIYSQHERVALACHILFNSGHDSCLSGQITAKVEDDLYITQTLGWGFDEVTVSNLLTVDSNLDVIEGDGIPNPANRFHSWIYNLRPDVNCILHTHAQYTSALSMLGIPLEISHMDCCILYDDVAYLEQWPGVPISNSEGDIISSALGDKNALLLGHHGLITVGRSIEEATCLALVFEKAAKLQLLALSAGEIKKIDFSLGIEAREWLKLDARISATFNYYVRRVLS
ncbi:MAG: aldolase [Oleispira sp.]|nr:aldolase [Oleispira sp.]MBL4879720.1 aldolase [Oleispira sp.]